MVASLTGRCAFCSSPLDEAGRCAQCARRPRGWAHVTAAVLFSVIGVVLLFGIVITVFIFRGSV